LLIGSLFSGQFSLLVYISSPTEQQDTPALPFCGMLAPRLLATWLNPRWKAFGFAPKSCRLILCPNQHLASRTRGPLYIQAVVETLLQLNERRKEDDDSSPDANSQSSPRKRPGGRLYHFHCIHGNQSLVYGNSFPTWSLEGSQHPFGANLCLRRGRTGSHMTFLATC
jgi:hypothetical protein